MPTLASNSRTCFSRSAVGSVVCLVNGKPTLFETVRNLASSAPSQNSQRLAACDFEVDSGQNLLAAERLVQVVDND